MSQGGHNRKMCVHEREYSVMCMFFFSVTVSQRRRGCRGSTAGLVKGLLLTVDSGGSTVKSTAGQRGSKGSTVGLQWVYSESLQLVVGIPLTVDCRL